MEAKDQKPAYTAVEQAGKDAARKEEATSSETLGDLEETQQVGTKDNDNTSGTGNAGPAPDGASDSDRDSTADGRATGDPM
jgi:hypothetical protein